MSFNPKQQVKFVLETFVKGLFDDEIELLLLPYNNPQISKNNRAASYHYGAARILGGDQVLASGRVRELSGAMTGRMTLGLCTRDLPVVAPLCYGHLRWIRGNLGYHHPPCLHLHRWLSA